jgi:hypothetical protein
LYIENGKTLIKFQEKRFLSGPSSKIFTVLAALLLLLIAWPLLARLDFYGTQLGRRLTYPFFQGSSEGLILSEVGLIRSGSSIYNSFRGDLFVSAPYPPAYYYLTAWVSGLFNTPDTSFVPGRIISLVSAVASGLLIAWQVFFFRPPVKSVAPDRSRFILKGLIATLAGLAFMTLPAVMVWSMRVRPDMLMTMLQLAGLALVAEGARRQRYWLVLASAIPFSLAIYTKQTALAGPAAAFIFLAFYYGRDWRKILGWLGVQVLATGLPFIILNLTTDGELYRRLFKYHNLPWLSANFSNYAQLFLQENLGLLLLGTGLVGLLLAAIVVRLRVARFKSTSDRLDSLIEIGRQVPLAVWYFAGSLALLGGLGVSGADHNHFLPAEAATALAGGVCAAWLLYCGRWRWLFLAGLAVYWAQLAIFSVPPSRYEIELRTRDADYQRQLGRIISYAASKPGPILSSESGFYILAGKTPQDGPYYNDLFTLAALDKQGLYSEEGLLNSIRAKKFAVVLAEGDLFNGQARPDVWTPELVEALKANYFRKFTDVWYTYEPLP